MIRIQEHAIYEVESFEKAGITSTNLNPTAHAVVWGACFHEPNFFWILSAQELTHDVNKKHVFS